MDFISDLYKWGQGERMKIWSFSDKFILWADLYNKQEIEKQREEYMAKLVLLPYQEKGSAKDFKVNRKVLLKRK